MRLSKQNYFKASDWSALKCVIWDTWGLVGNAFEDSYKKTVFENNS